MSLKSFLKHTISVENPTGSTDRHGDDAFGAATDVPARAERKFKVTVDKDKERRPIHMQFIVGPSSTVLIGARVTYDGEVYRVVERNDAPGRRGDIHHYELMCQYWSFSS